MSLYDDKAHGVASEGLEAFEAPSYEIIPASVIESCSAKMSSGYGGGGGGGGSTAFLMGTEANPESLICGIEKTTQTAYCWYKCVVAGSIDLEIEYSPKEISADCQFDLYYQTSNGNSKSLLQSFVGSGVPISASFSLYGSVTVYLKLKSSSVCNYQLGIYQHCDTAQLPYGGQWKSQLNCGSAQKDKTPIEIFFCPRYRVNYVITAIEHDGATNWIEDVASGVVTVASVTKDLAAISLAFVTDGASVGAAVLVNKQYKWIVKLFADQVVSPLMKKLQIAWMVREAEITDWNNPNSSAKHGLRMIHYRDKNGNDSFEVEAWDEPEADGPTGSIGKMLLFAEE
jgi:hypothetical protein